MLVNLHVKNLAIIDEIEVDFSDHLNILTGETGAGKSILIDSINIALGGKVSADMIRKGADQALVELTFSIENPGVLKHITELDIPVEDNTIIITRKIRNGKSISKVNGESVTNAVLKELAGLLIDIHGQHEHQSLLYKKKHLTILDQFGKESTKEHLESLETLYSKYITLKKEQEEAQIPEEERLRELSFLEYEKNEIENARLQKGEDILLEQQYKRMSNSNTIVDHLGSVYQITGGGESISDAIGRALKHINRVTGLDEEIAAFEEQLGHIDGLMNDFNRDMADYLSEMEFDSNIFGETEDRLNRINTLKAKYGPDLEDVEHYREQLEDKLQRLEDYDLYMEELKEKLAKTEQQMEKESEKLSKLRKKNAIILKEKITEALIELNFLDVKFEIHFEKLHSYTAKGYDEIEFLISTNPGEDLKPLGKVASGGELSRIMLAIKSIMANEDFIETLIFDEIDTGISGRTAQKVSERLSQIAGKHQVISITHLPQIASMADEHYIIEKTTDGTTTKTSIEPLDFEKSVIELARMLGGAQITDAVIASAREMKELAAALKCQK